jgi:hypothetical protein
VKCVILQPSYLPWRGYFHQIQKADVFVFYDDVQYDKNGWRNRNRIKTSNGVQWLTVPVLHKGVIRAQVPIQDVLIDWGRDWSRKHWQTIEQAYRKAPYFDAYAGKLKPFFESRPQRLVELTIPLTICLAEMLGIHDTQFVRASELGVSGARTERLLAILQRLGASHYISGPAARDYLQEDRLAAAGITLEYMKYDYPEYPQLYPPFDPNLSVIDLIFMVGPAAWGYIGDTAEVPLPGPGNQA